MDGAGEIYVSFGGQVRVYDSVGTQRRTWTVTDGCAGSIAIDPVGDVYVTGCSGIEKTDSTGAPLGRWGATGFRDGQFRSPRGLAIDAAGDVYVADSGNYRIQKFDARGSFLGKWGTAGDRDGSSARRTSQSPAGPCSSPTTGAGARRPTPRAGHICPTSPRTRSTGTGSRPGSPATSSPATSTWRR